MLLPLAAVASTRWLVLLAASLGASGRVAAQPMPGDSLIVSGVVKKPNGSAASRRKVKLGGISVHSEAELETITDSQGCFRFIIAADSLQKYPSLSCLYVPRLGWNFQTAGADVEMDGNGSKAYVLQLSKHSKLARQWAVRHPAY